MARADAADGAGCEHRDMATIANPHAGQRFAVHDREDLLDRLHRLRRMLPAYAADAASARREAAALRIENRRLLDEVRRLQRRNGAGAR